MKAMEDFGPSAVDIMSLCEAKNKKVSVDSFRPLQALWTKQYRDNAIRKLSTVDYNLKPWRKLVEEEQFEMWLDFMVGKSNPECHPTKVNSSEAKDYLRTRVTLKDLVGRKGFWEPKPEEPTPGWSVLQTRARCTTNRTQLRS